MNLITFQSKKIQRWVSNRDSSRWSRSRRRLFHRMLAGVKKARYFHKQIWFVTLTTSDEFVEINDLCGGDSRELFKRHFSALVKRARREFGRFEYVVVHTNEGNGVYHLLCNSLSIGRRFSYGGYRGPKALWFWFSEQWLDLHFSPVVWSVLVRGYKKVVNYVLKYLHFQDCFLRYHWSWRWVYPAFVHDWTSLFKSFKRRFSIDTGSFFVAGGMVFPVRVLPKDKMKDLFKEWDKLVYAKCLNLRLPQCKLDEWV